MVTDSMDVNLSKLRETVKDRGAWCAAAHGVAKNGTELSYWTAINVIKLLTETVRTEEGCPPPWGGEGLRGCCPSFCCCLLIVSI